MLLNFTQEKSRISLVFVLFIGLFSISETAYSSELNVYSHRQPFLINPFLSASFTIGTLSLNEDTPYNISLYPNPVTDILTININLGSNEVVNILDIVQLANMILSGEYADNADLNSDGQVNILDIVQIVNIILAQ